MTDFSNKVAESGKILAATIRCAENCTKKVVASMIVTTIYYNEDLRFCKECIKNALGDDYASF